jgi:hypothetical protein
MWCLRCYEPVRLLTRRDPQLPTPADLVPIDPAEARPDHVWIRLDKPVYSRVRAGATTWGLWGRVGLSAIVLAFAPWGAFTVTSMFYLLTYIPISILLLRSIWHREVVGTVADAGVVYDVETLRRLRLGTIAVGAVLSVVALSVHSTVLGYLPALVFLAIGGFPQAALVLAEAIEEAKIHPIGTLVLLNALNVLDAVLSDAAIGAGVARELNPLVLAIGTPAKIVLVMVCSCLLLWRRPQALVWPTLAFVALASYHLTGLLGALSVA